MNKLILATALVFSINIQANDFSDVGPEILFYDMHGTSDNHHYSSDIVATPTMTAGIDFSDVGPEILFYDYGDMSGFDDDNSPIAVINHNKGKREYLHEDVVPAALLY